MVVVMLSIVPSIVLKALSAVPPCSVITILPQKLRRRLGQVTAGVRGGCLTLAATSEKNQQTLLGGAECFSAFPQSIILAPMNITTTTRVRTPKT
jgi:hypothetical protein